MVYTRNLPSRPASGHAWSSLTAIAILCATAACDQSEGGSVRERECKRFCDSLERCDDRTDVLDCQKHCESDEVRSDAYFRSRAECAQDACNLWSSEVDTQGDDTCTGSDCHLLRCINRKLADVKLSPQEEQSCSTMATSLYNCDGSLDRDAISSECKRVTPILSSQYRADSERCVQSLCAEIVSCLDDLADREGTELKIFSGTVNR